MRVFDSMLGKLEGQGFELKSILCHGEGAIGNIKVEQESTSKEH
jgi:hypothetical protein